MIVHFITSRPTLEEDIKTLRAISAIVKEAGHSLASDWIEEAYKRQTLKESPQADWSSIFKVNIGNIAQSDVVIAETSQESFAVGYQIAAAVQQKKPVLLLRHASADKNAFVTGVEDGWIKHVEYDEHSLDAIIKKFLDENDIKSKDMRFNFFIDRKIYNYLRWAAFKTGKTKAEILRDLVQNEIDKQEK